jgi:hypothetical protein
MSNEPNDSSKTSFKFDYLQMQNYPNPMSYPIINGYLTYTIPGTSQTTEQLNTLTNENKYLKQLIELKEENIKLKEEMNEIKNKKKLIETAYIDFLKSTNKWTNAESYEHIEWIYKVSKL